VRRILKWGGITFGGLVLLVIVVALLDPVEDGSESAGGGSASSERPLRIGREGKVEAEYEVTDESTGEAKNEALGLAVTPSKVADPATTDTPPSEIENGTRWVRTRVRIENTASDTYDISDGQWNLVTKDGQRVLGNDVTPVGPGTQLDGMLLDGDSQVGTVVFLVPKGSKPKELRFEPLVGAEGGLLRWRTG